MNAIFPVALDVHVLISQDTYKPWVSQCLASIEAAIARAPFPVQLFTVRGVVGHIGAGRAKGYQFGSAPYVTYVDDDDFIEPHAFEVLAPVLATGPDAVFPLERALLNGIPCQGEQRHHLPIYRRCHIIDHQPFPSCGDIAQIEYVRNLRVVDIAEVLYNHRLYSTSKARALRRRYPKELPHCLQYPAAVP